MKKLSFLVISGSALKKDTNGLFGYGPYIKELNIWLRHVGNTEIIAPINQSAVSPIDLKIDKSDLRFFSFSEFSIIGIKNKIQSLFLVPYIFSLIVFRMFKADVIHLRCPSNVALIGVFAQILFPWKKKIVKYAANWDPNSKQPWSSKVQQYILKNTFLTHNAQVLVYGTWPDKTRNIKPFFTASYVNKDIVPLPQKSIRRDETLQLIYVGTLTENKKPLLSANVALELLNKGFKVELNFYGDGIQRKELEAFIATNKLENSVFVHGNRTAEEVKNAFKKAHALVFISRSEGWPKVVAEAMFWGCVPVTTRVSMVPEMVGNGKRGLLVAPDLTEIVAAIESLFANPQGYTEMSDLARDWSQQYTLESFESEIIKLLKTPS